MAFNVSLRQILRMVCALAIFAAFAWLLPVPGLGIGTTDQIPQIRGAQILLPSAGPQGSATKKAAHSIAQGTASERQRSGSLLAGPLSLAETSQIETVQISRATQADFVFLIDGTNSMDDEIDAVRNGLSTFVTSLDSAGVDARFAIVLFGGNPELVHDFTRSISDTKVAFGKISVHGSVKGFQNNHNKNPEEGLEAIRTALGAGSDVLAHNNAGGTGELRFRPGARKNLILVTDEDSDRPFHSGNRLPGQSRLEPPASIRGTDWQREVDVTAQAIIGNQAFVNLLINPGDKPSTSQYGDPASDAAGADLLNFDAQATLSALVASGFGKSLEAQVLRAGLIARAFNIGALSDPDFVKNFFAAKVEEVARRETRKQGPGHLNVVATQSIAGVSAPSRFELILDASGSMVYRHQKIDGRLKMEVAKQVMEEIIRDLPEGAEVALRVYGHRVREAEAGSCKDTEVLGGGFQRVQKSGLIQRVGNIRALGTTPLAYSLVKAAQDLATAPGEKLIVLVTDGKEECGGNPVEVVSELANLGLEMRVEVVGFALAEPKTKADMEAVAKITGGQYHDARDSASLRNALKRALESPYAVFDEDGTEVASGRVGGEAILLPEGSYTVVVHGAEEDYRIPKVRIHSARRTKIGLSSKDGRIVYQRLPSGDRGAADEAAPQAVAASPRHRVEEATPSAQIEQVLGNLEAELLERMEAVEGQRRVRRAQRHLAKLGFEPGPADGQWGPRTENAVRSFQRWYPRGGLTPSGKLDEVTVRALDKAVSEGMRYDARAGLTLEGAPVLLDTARLLVDDRSIRLYGVEGLSGELAVQMRRFIRERGGWVRCVPETEQAYVCRTRGGIDLAEAALLNGAARVRPGAPDIYLRRERAARDAGRGIWAR